MSYSRSTRLLTRLLVVTSSLVMGSSFKTSRPADVPPDQALATFQLAEGFQIELVAMEIDKSGQMEQSTWWTFIE